MLFLLNLFLRMAWILNAIFKMDFRYRTLSSFDRVPCLFLTALLACIRSIVVLAYNYTYTINDCNTKKYMLAFFFKNVVCDYIATYLHTSRFIISFGVSDFCHCLWPWRIYPRAPRRQRDILVFLHTDCRSLSHEECTQHSLLPYKPRKKHNAGMPLFLGSKQHILWPLQLYQPC